MADVVYLLPGLLCDHDAWTHQIAVLAQTRDVRVADFGQSDSIGEMAAQLLDEAPAGFSLAGHSMGGRVALEIVRRAPERVQRLALLDTGVHPPQPNERAKREVLIDLAFKEGMQRVADVWLPPMLHLSSASDALVASLRAMVMRKTPEIFRNQQEALLTRPDAGAGLSQIRCPLLVGVGRHDAWSPVAQHQAIAAEAPGAHLVIFEDSGHMAPVEAPIAVTKALLGWLGRSAPL